MSANAEKRTLHIEPTTRCTLSCPHCPRTQHSDLLTIRDCDIDVMVRTCAGFDHIHLCGNHGDPIYHPQFHELLARLRQQKSDVTFSMHTNGAFRSMEWWKTTATLFNRHDSVAFSIDGLPQNYDTYRVNSRWDSVLEAITTLRSNSPHLKMLWKWIVFRYNQDDIEAGMALAKDLGFDKFLMRCAFERGGANHPLYSTRTLQETAERLRAKSLS